MKQVLQDLESGQVVVREIPDPMPASGRLLVRVQCSLLSAGTESAQVAKGRQSLLDKVRQKPELIRKGIEELRERGLAGIREKLASKFEGFTDIPSRVVFTHDGNRLIAGDFTGKLHVWSVKDKTLVGELTTNPSP